MVMGSATLFGAVALFGGLGCMIFGTIVKAFLPGEE